MTTITSAAQMFVGKRYTMTICTVNFFRAGVDSTAPFTVKRIAGGLVTIRFDGTTFDQFFSTDRIVAKDIIVSPAPKFQTPPQYLSRQCRLILKQLQEGNTITQRSALMDFSIMALPRRIADLKYAGYEINSRLEYNTLTGQRFARYSLAA